MSSEPGECRAFLCKALPCGFSPRQNCRQACPLVVVIAVSTLAGCPPWDRRFSPRGLTGLGLGSGSGLGSVLTFGQESRGVLGFDLVSGGAVVSVRARAQREARCCREPWGSDEGAMRPGRPCSVRPRAHIISGVQVPAGHTLSGPQPTVTAMSKE